MKIKTGIVCTLIMIFGVSTLFSIDLKINDGERFTFSITDSKGETYTSDNQFHVQTNGGVSIYSYTNESKYEKWDVKTDAKGIPLAIQFSAKGNDMELTFHGNGNVEMTGYWSGKEIDKAGNYSENVSLENALIVRTLDFDSSSKYAFDLLQTSKLPRLVAYPMYFKVVGEEEVTVQAGTFKCKKVQFSLTDMRGFFYKAYYYISDDEHRYIVKIKNVPMGGSTELINIE